VDDRGALEELVAERLARADEHLVHRLARAHPGDVQVGLAGRPRLAPDALGEQPIGSSSGRPR
jgi:hypothetical protein